MSIRAKTKRRLIVVAVGLLLVFGAGLGVYLRYLQKFDAAVAAHRKNAMAAYAAGDYAGALPHFDKYLTLSKTAERPAGKADTEALLAYGKSRAAIETPSNRHLWEAKNVFERYLALRPGDSEAQGMLLDIYPKLNHNQEAIGLADEVLSRDPNDTRALRSKTRALIQKGLLQEPKAFGDALAVAEKLNAVAPLDLNGHLLAQYTLFCLKRPADEVIGRANDLLADHPDDPRFELLLASAYLYADRMEPARQWLKSAASRKAPDVAFVDELVTRLDSVGQFAQSQEVLERAAGDFPGEASLTRAAIERLWQAGRYDAVLERLGGMDPRSPKSDPALVGLRALTLLKHPGMDKEAAPIIEALSERAGTDNVALAWSTALKTLSPWLGGDAFSTTRPGAAGSNSAGGNAAGADSAGAGALLKEGVEKLKASLEKDPGNPFFHYYLAAFYKGLGERTLAIESLNQAWRRAPAWAEPRRAAAGLLAEEGRYAEAVRRAEDAYRRSPGDLDVVVTWAQAAYGLLETLPEQRELDRLLRMVQEIQRVAPGEPNTLPIYAAVLARSGKPEEAGDVVRSALSAKPPHPPEVLARLAAVSREAGLGMDEEIAGLLRDRVAEGGPAAAYTAAVERYYAGQPAEGLKLLKDAAAKAAGGDDKRATPQWRRVVAQYLDLAGDPEALKHWVELADQHPGDLLVQTAALRARCRQYDRAFWRRTIDRVKQLTVENSQLWRLEEARWMLTGELGEKEQAAVLATLTELARNAPFSAEPQRLLAVAHERTAAGQAPQAQQQSLRSAAEAMTRAWDLRPGDGGVTAELVRLLRLTGRSEEAVKYLDRAAARPHLEPAGRLRLAELYADQGQYAKAIALASPLGDDALPRLAKWHRATGDETKAADAYAKLLDDPRLDATTVLDAATYFAARGKTTDAEKFLAKLDGMKLRPGGKELIRAKYAERFAPAEATKLFADAARQPGASPGVWRELSGHLLRQKKFPDALAAAEAGLRATDPKDADLLAIRERVRELEAVARDPLAQPLILFLSYDPRNAAAGDMLIVLKESAAGRLPAGDAAARFRAAADRHPSFLPLQVAAARAHLKLGEPQKAEAVARRAAASFPDDPEAARLLAAVYSGMGRWQELREAATAWRRLAGDNPLEPDLHVARAMLNLSDAAGAAERLERYATSELRRIESQPQGQSQDAPRVEPLKAEAVELYARALIHMGRADDAAAALEPAAKQSGLWRRVWLELAAAFRTRDRDAAVAWVTRVEPLVQKDQDAPGAARERCDLATAWYTVGREFNDRQSLEAAKRVATPLRGRDEVAAEAWMVLAASDESLGNLQDAERQYRQALSLRPDMPDVQNNLAYVLLQAESGAGAADGGKRLAEARELARKAVAASPNVASFHDTLARVDAKRGDSESAVKSFRRALELDGGSIEAMIGLADVLAQTGRGEEAKAQLAQIDNALQLTPRLPEPLAKQLESVRAAVQDGVRSGRAE